MVRPVPAPSMLHVGSSNERRGVLLPVVLLGLVLLAGACRSEPEAPPVVTSYLEGRLTVDPSIDPTPDYAGFELLVASEDTSGAIDTLGYAVTDTSGAFRMTVWAPERGIYPLVVSRRGTVLAMTQLVVAEGDSAMLTAQFPLGNRLLRIRSTENAAWTAYLNTRAQHNDALMRVLQEGGYDAGVLRRQVVQASEILWSLRQNYPGTIGADVASAEAIVMLDGWADSLLLARAPEIEPENPSYVEVARAARRAKAREAGLDSALALVRRFQERAGDAETKAALQSEIVVAYADSMHRSEALQAAEEIQRAYAGTQWVPWAGRAIYEIEHLSPGMPAPSFTLTTLNRTPVSLAQLKGRFVVLEFYQPEDPEFQSQLPGRNALARALGGDALRFVSVSMQPDTLLNEAFIEGRDFPGLHVVAPLGLRSEIARAYNVSALPTRVLIDRQGLIVRKYVGNTLARLQDDLVALLSEPSPPA